MEEYWIEQILIIINQVYKDWENMSLNFTFLSEKRIFNTYFTYFETYLTTKFEFTYFDVF